MLPPDPSAISWDLGGNRKVWSDGNTAENNENISVTLKILKRFVYFCVPLMLLSDIIKISAAKRTYLNEFSDMIWCKCFEEKSFVATGPQTPQLFKVNMSWNFLLIFSISLRKLSGKRNFSIKVQKVFSCQKQNNDGKHFCFLSHLVMC